MSRRTKSDDERALRDALEQAQQRAKLAETRVEQLLAEGEASRQADRAPLEQQLHEAQRRFDELTRVTDQKLRDLGQAWAREVQSREDELRRLQRALALTPRAQAGAPYCEKCRSPNVVTNVGILDQGKYGAGLLQAAVDQNPGAFFAVGRHVSECAHVELTAPNARALYDAAAGR